MVFIIYLYNFNVIKMKKLGCFLDGDNLCIVAEDFVNLQESDAVFLDISLQDLKAIEKLEEYNECLKCTQYFCIEHPKNKNKSDPKLMEKFVEDIQNEKTVWNVISMFPEIDSFTVEAMVDLYNKNKKLRQKNEKQEVEIKRLKTQVESQESWNSILNKQNQKLIEKIKNLESEIERREELDRTSRNILIKELNELRGHRKICMELTNQLIEINQGLIDKIEYIRNKEEDEPDDIIDYIHFHIGKMRSEGKEPKYLIAHRDYIIGIIYTLILTDPFETDSNIIIKGLELIETERDIIMIA